MRAHRTDRIPDPLALVGAEIVQHDDVAGNEGRDQGVIFVLTQVSSINTSRDGSIRF